MISFNLFEKHSDHARLFLARHMVERIGGKTTFLFLWHLLGAAGHSDGMNITVGFDNNFHSLGYF